MDWQSIWHEHKVFIRNVGIGAAVYLVLVSYTQSLALDAQKLSTKNERKLQSLRETEQGLKNMEGIEKGRAEALAGNLEPQILGRLLWKLADNRSVPKDKDNRYLAFTEKKREASLKIRAAAQRRNTPMPKSYGFLARSNEALVDEHCVRIDLTERFLTKLLELGVDRVKNVDQEDVVYSPLPFSEEKKRYLARIPVSFEATIDPKVLPTLLAEFQKEGQFVELLKLRKTKVRRSKEGRVDLRLTIAALVIVNKIPDGKSAGPSGANPTGGPGVRPVPGGRPLRRFGRRR